MTEGGFDDAALAALRDRDEVRVQTQGADGSVHRTVIWVVVDEHDRVLIRSVRGAGARWYREAISGRPVRLVVDDDVQPVAIEVARDADRVAACSRELETKYAGDPELGAMLRVEVLDTTLELHPA